jgi:hypothetical protein
METTTAPVTPTNYLTHPSLQHLTTLPASLQHRSPTMKRICQALARQPHGARNMTRREVMAQVLPSTALPTSGGCYWRRMHSTNYAGMGRAGSRRPTSHDEARYSVIVNGLVRVAGKRGRQLTYELTPAGEMFARS